jgi:drug/metabolite transporter (DMT)-like permease
MTASRPLNEFVKREYDNPSTITTHLMLTLVQLIFALMHTLANSSLEYIPSFAFCTLRLACALPFLGLFAYLEKKTQIAQMTNREQLWIIPMGTFLGIAYLLVFVTNERSGAIAVASVQPLMPVCTALLSFLFGLEPMGVLKAFGCALGFAGTIMAVKAHKILDEVGPSVADVMLLLLQTCSYSFYVVMVVKASIKLKNFGMTFLFRATLFAWTWIFFVGGLKAIFIDIEWAKVPTHAWGGVLFSGFGSAVVAHGINSWAITRVNGVLPTVYSGVQVAFTVLFGLTFLNEDLESLQFVGIAITIVGVYCVARSRVNEKRTTTTANTLSSEPGIDADDILVFAPDIVPHRPTSTLLPHHQLLLLPPRTVRNRPKTRTRSTSSPSF